jgi:cell division protein FtsZ
VVAELAREMGILTVAVVTKPFVWEGPVRERNAQAGLDALRRCADTVIVVPNQKLLSVVEKNTTMRQAFTIADEILSSATRGISEIVLKPGEIQVDFADVRTIMSHGGDALMGMGRASGENRATLAMDRAVHSPLLENVSIAGATGVLVNFTGNEDMGMMEVHDAMNSLYESIGSETQPHIIFGMVINPEMKDEIAVTVIATGFGTSSGPKIQAARPALEPQRRIVTPEYRPVILPEIQPEVTARPDRFFSAPQPKASEETNSGKIPLGARPAPRPIFTPQPRPEEVRVAPESGDAATRGAAYGSAQRGRFSESHPDIDYDTPAFLRNQVD